MSSLGSNLRSVQERVRLAALSAGRDPKSVRLIAVSKAQPSSAVREAYAAGQRDFGENYVQELVDKAEQLRDLPDLRWHMIGHLQRNKVRVLRGVAALVHSVDSIRLCTELAKRAQEFALEPARRFIPDDPRLGVLVEVNLAEELQKSGCEPSQLGALLAAIEMAPTLRLSGLMCVPPLSNDPRSVRPYFDHLVRLRNEHGGGARLPELSMGMTADFEVAIASGATLVRVGTAIFGERRRMLD